MIDDRAVRQVVEGFGASMTDSAAYMLNEFDRPQPRRHFSLLVMAKGINPEI